VAGDQVAAQRVAEPQRALEVNTVARLQGPERGQRQRLGAEVRGEVSDRVFDDGQADAVDRDAGAQRQRLDRELGPDHQAHDSRLLQLDALDRFDYAEAFNNAGEHAASA